MKTSFKLFFILAALVSCKNLSLQNPRTAKTPAIVNLSGKEISADSIEKFIEHTMIQMGIPGLSLAIINNGEVVYHATKGYANVDEKQPVTNQTIFEGASISKPMFAYLVMHLVDEGKLELDKPLYQYLDYQYPGINDKDERYKLITARMVLSHSTGFPNWRGDSDLNIQFEPGTKFGYSAEGYQYLEKVIESILNTNYLGLESYFQEKVAVPLKMLHTKYIQDSYNITHKATPYKNGERLPIQGKSEEFNAAAGIHSEAKEYSNWLIALMNQEGLTQKSYNELFTDQIAIPKSEWFSTVGITNWTLGFAKHKFDFLNVPIYGHIGNNEGYTSLFLIDLNKKWGIASFTNADQADDFGFDLFKYINKAD